MLLQKLKSKNPYVVMVVSVMDTMKNLPIGRPVLFDCRELGPIQSVRSAASRLRNSMKFDITTEDNGATYTVLRTE